MGGIRLISDNKTVYSPVDVMFDESLDFEVSRASCLHWTRYDLNTI